MSLAFCQHVILLGCYSCSARNQMEPKQNLGTMAFSDYILVLILLLMIACQYYFMLIVCFYSFNVELCSRMLEAWL